MCTNRSRNVHSVLADKLKGGEERPCGQPPTWAPLQLSSKSSHRRQKREEVSSVPTSVSGKGLLVLALSLRKACDIFREWFVVVGIRKLIKLQSSWVRGG